MVIWLAVLTGILNGTSSLLLSWGKYANLGNFQQFSIIVAELVLGVIIALAYLYIISWIYMVVGRWVKGEGHYHDVKTAIGWSFYPWGITAIFGVISLILPNPQVQSYFSLVYAVLSIWSFIIFLKLLGESQRFSVWRALGAVAITLLLVMCLVLLIGLIFTIIRAT